MNNKIKKIVIILVSIAIISLFLKLHTFDFSIPVHFDDLRYSLDAIQYSQGDYFIPQKKNPGWSLFVTPFYMMMNSDNFIDYSNLIRILGLAISTISIVPMYLLAKRFFNEKFSLVAVTLFAFEPHLNYISGQGLSEPLFNLFYIKIRKKIYLFIISSWRNLLVDTIRRVLFDHNIICNLFYKL